MEKITGDESAFPIDSDDLKQVSTGLTIRQHYAGLAMQGLISSVDWSETIMGEDHIEETAKAAVKYADALVKALNKEKQ